MSLAVAVEVLMVMELVDLMMVALVDMEEVVMVVMQFDENAVENTGGGGGGSEREPNPPGVANPGGHGASGIVLLAYPT